MSEQSQLVAPNGKPARAQLSDKCPDCRASRDKRIPSCGFGEPHDVCGNCGHDFEEYTCG